MAKCTAREKGWVLKAPTVIYGELCPHGNVKPIIDKPTDICTGCEFLVEGDDKK